jgi:hypothetical protein
MIRRASLFEYQMSMRRVAYAEPALDCLEQEVSSCTDGRGIGPERVSVYEERGRNAVLIIS